MFEARIRKQRGAYTNVGGSLGSTFGTVQELTDSYYDALGREFANVLPMGKSAGSTIYGTNGAVNPIYGAKMTVQMFNSQNAFTGIGAKPYDHEGVRIVEKLALFGGIGAETSRDGDVPDSVKPDIAIVREPYKELPMSWDYGLGLMALEGYDDTINFQTFADIQASTYGDALDKDLLRPTATVMPTKDGEETTLTPLSHIIASFDEISKVYNGTTITDAMVSPYGGTAGDLYGYRSAGKSTFDSVVIDGQGTLTLNNLKDLYYGIAPYFDNQGSPDNKMFLISSPAIQMVDAERETNNRVITGSPDVYVKWTMDGVSTMPGMDAGGVTMRALYNIPAIMDNNLIVDRTNGMFLGNELGEVFGVDSDYLAYSMLTPINLRSTDASEVTRVLRRVSLIHSRGEVRCNRFIGQGKIANTSTTPTP